MLTSDMSAPFNNRQTLTCKAQPMVAFLLWVNVTLLSEFGFQYFPVTKTEIQVFSFSESLKIC